MDLGMTASGTTLPTSLPTGPSFERIALNRVTFGARLSDIARVKSMGWKAWVEDQLRPPVGDDAELASFLDAQQMFIKYNGLAPATGIPGWPPVSQYRALNYLKQDVAGLWEVPRKIETAVAADEYDRIGKELNAVTWIRNSRSIYQVREFMVDFWNNHFNIGRQADFYATAALPVYDLAVIRPRAFGNFLDLLTAVATSASMLRYLDNASSTAAHPNENYAREILELHTLGRPAYIGVGKSGAKTGKPGDIAARFSDQDIIQASRALSGWTLEQGQDGPDGTLPFTGKFIFNPAQHNANAGIFMGVDLSAFAGMDQGKAVLKIIANHPATADFVCTKIARRMFGDGPPSSVIARGKRAWLANRDQPDQIRHVLAAMLMDGEDIGRPGLKLRRPYERVMAYVRTADVILSAFPKADTALAPLGDGIYAWPTPDGRPDMDSQWLSGMANLYAWNYIAVLHDQDSFHTNLAAQTPEEVRSSPTALVEFWVNRMVGYALRPVAMEALVADAGSPSGALAALNGREQPKAEAAIRRLTALIAASPEFGTR
jgi:uncharacterized protein (DUF1800 family)